MNKQRSKIKEPRRTAVELSSSVPRPSSLIVIGYGNELRGDDAVGQQVARAVAAWEIPGVRAITVPQLMPELVDELAHNDIVIFVDAYLAASETAKIQVHTLDALPLRNIVWHAGEPFLLLALAKEVYDCSPRAWWILVPATNFAYGVGLSCIAQAGAGAALDLIRMFISV